MRPRAQAPGGQRRAWRRSFLTACALLALIGPTASMPVAAADTLPGSCGDPTLLPDTTTKADLADLAKIPTLPDTPGAEPFRTLLTEAIDYLSAPAHLNHPLAVKTRIVFCAAAAPGDDAATKIVTATTASGAPLLVGCIVAVFPKGRDYLTAGDGKRLTSMMTHEAFHCFTAASIFPSSNSDLPKWLFEGAAAWAGESAAGGSGFSSDVWWLDYLAHPTTRLFDRSYSALGFFAHMQESGVNPWGLLDDMHLAAVGKPAPPTGMTPERFAFRIAAVAKSDVRNAWPSGVVRDSAGYPWDTDGPGITANRYDPDALALETDLFVADAANDVKIVDLSGDVIRVTVTPGTAGMLRAADGQNYPMIGADYCARDGGCACPSTSASIVAMAPIASGPALAAVSGNVPDQANPMVGSTVRFSALSLDTVCDEPGSTPPGGVSRPPGGLGTDPCSRYQPEPVLRALAERTETLDNECFYTLYDGNSVGWTWVRFHDPTSSTTATQAREEFQTYLSEALAHGIGDDRDPVTAKPMGGGDPAYCILPASYPGRNAVRGHALVLRGNAWFDLALLDTRASSYRDYPPLCTMLENLAKSIP